MKALEREVRNNSKQGLGPGVSVLQTQVNGMAKRMSEIRRLCSAFDRGDFWNVNAMYTKVLEMQDKATELLVILEKIQQERLAHETRRLQNAEQPALFDETGGENRNQTHPTCLLYTSPSPRDS